jgi:hypothetical protein
MREVIEKFDFDNTISKLDEAGLGRFVEGRRGKKSRIEWLVPVAALASAQDEAAAARIADAVGAAQAEQRRRFLDRIEAPEKNWKFSAQDVVERRFWDEYQAAYEKAIRATATPEAPWYVVPADNKWFTRLIVAGALAAALEGLGLHYPRVDQAARERLAAARKELG